MINKMFSKYKKYIILSIIFLLLLIVVNSINNEDNNDLVNINNSNYDIDDFHITVEPLGDGYDLYIPKGMGYRYGPSILYNEDGSMDAWFSSPGNNSTEWDYIRYRHSDDGINWSSESVVLKPTAGSTDHYSTCDPGVIYFNGYYYLGYTSTTNKDGYDNDIYVARSKYPDGPYEKWNGSGWGGNPVPLIDYAKDPTYWGAGEISFCIVDEKLYCYYTFIDETGYHIKMCTADLVENWPSTLSFSQIVIYGVNSCEAVYIEKYEKFVVLALEQQFTSDSNIAIYESYDGANFTKTDNVKSNVHDYAHSIGISKGIDGHIDIDEPLILGYAYSKNSNDPWGKWSTYFQSVKFKLFVEKINKE